MTSHSDSLRMALVQADTKYDSVQGNLSMLEEMMEAETQTVDIFLLPELFNTGYQNAFTAQPEVMGLTTTRWMSLMANRKNAAIGGSVSISENGQVFNRFLFALPTGAFLDYDKQRVFKFSGEDKVFTSGTASTMWEFKGWKIKPIVCFDLRFPELVRNYPPYYDLILCTAHWPRPRISAWDKLLQARAIENQCYVAAVNRFGVEGTSEYPGHSVVVDYEGKVVTDAGEQTGIVYAELNKPSQEQFRERFPFLPE